MREPDPSFSLSKLQSNLPPTPSPGPLSLWIRLSVERSSAYSSSSPSLWNYFYYFTIICCGCKNKKRAALQPWTRRTLQEVFAQTAECGQTTNQNYFSCSPGPASDPCSSLRNIWSPRWQRWQKSQTWYKPESSAIQTDSSSYLLKNLTVPQHSQIFQCHENAHICFFNYTAI